MISAPDYAEPIIGWRMWYAIPVGKTTFLESVIHRTKWPRHYPLVASCRCLRVPIWPFNRRERHDAPAPGCRCGIHAAPLPVVRAYLPEQLGFTDLVPVVGRVSLWGIVHEHEHGWRASLAYPERLYVPASDLGPARATQVMSGLAEYGIPVYAVGGLTADAVIEEVVGLAA